MHALIAVETQQIHDRNIDKQMIVAIALLTIIRTIINIVIYRHEYDYHGHTDGVAINFAPKEVEKRDNMVILVALGLITIFWMNYKKPENRTRVILSNVLSLVCVLLLAVLLFEKWQRF